MSPPPATPFRRRFFRVLRIVVLLLLLAVGLLFYPPIFQFALRQGIALETWRRGGRVQIGEVTGSLTGEPITLLNTQWSYFSGAGAITRIVIARAEAQIDWRELLPGGGRYWFQQLSLQGVTGKINLPRTPDPMQSRRGGEDEGGVPLAWFPPPARVEAKDVDLIFQSEEDYIRLQECRGRVSELEQGFIEIGQLTVKQPWLNRGFRNVNGTTALQDGRIVVANLQLDAGVVIKSFSAGLAEVARGRLDYALDLSAFGGSIRAQAQTNAPSRGPEFEASGNFSEIHIAQLATFLGLSDATGGTVQEGKFTFRGSPGDPMRATATLRLQATNFQWESRQWDSLALGATLMDRRLQIPELVLRQGHNHLSLNGEVALPGGADWRSTFWQSDFNCNLNAQIENLTELSALLLPEFQYAAGQVSIDGSMRGKDQQFSGHLIAAGKDLSWRNTPIQELHAAIRLAGSEVQIASLDLLNKDDYLHGQGVIGAGGDYRGDLRASVEDFGKYASLLEDWLLPEPLGGGAMLRWSGGRTAHGQAGNFYARLHRFRPLRTEGSKPHPVEVELEGSYEPGQMQFSRFHLADEECEFSTQLALDARTVHFRQLELRHGEQIWLQGEAQVPLEFCRNWMTPLPPAPSGPAAPLQLALKATGLSLRHAARLSGWDWPIEGFVDGAVSGGGPLGRLALQGQLTLRSGRLPIGWNGDSLSAVQGQLKAEGQTLTLSQVQAEHRTGKYAGRAQLDLTRYADPELTAKIQGERALFPLFQDVREGAAGAPLWCQADVHLRIHGPLTSARVEGEVLPRQLHTVTVPALGSLWRRTENALPTPPLPLPFVVAIAPFYRWTVDLNLAAPAPIPVSPGEGNALPHLRLQGLASHPQLVGEVKFSGLPVLAGALPLMLKSADLTFAEGRAQDPMLDLQVVGTYQYFPFSAYVLGPYTRHMSFADSAEALAQMVPLESSMPLSPLLPSAQLFPLNP